MLGEQAHKCSTARKIHVDRNLGYVLLVNTQRDISYAGDFSPRTKV